MLSFVCSVERTRWPVCAALLTASLGAAFLVALAGLYIVLKADVDTRTRKLREAETRLREALQKTAHEIRSALTPLATGVALLEMQVDEGRVSLPPPVVEKVRMFVRATGHLKCLIDDLLDFARIDAGEVRLEIAPMDLLDILHDVGNAMRPTAERAGLTMRVETSGVTAAPVEADRERIRQVLMNLTGNAIKFTKQGDVTLGIQVRAQTWRVFVRDTGVGIAPADHKRIFDAFQQVPTPSARAPGGAGLGLTISRQLAELHGGRLWVESDGRNGSTFWLEVLKTEENGCSSQQRARP